MDFVSFLKGIDPHPHGHHDEFFDNDIETYTKLGIVIDFDGTLAYTARTPEMAMLPCETKRVLERLSNMTDVNIVIISGREMEDLRRKVGVEEKSPVANQVSANAGVGIVPRSKVRDATITT